MIIIQKINMNLEAHGVPSRIDAVQGDAYTRKVEINLFSGETAWEIPEDAKVLVRFQKPDGHCGAYDMLPDGTAAAGIIGNTVSVVLLPQMLTAAGLVRMQVSLIRGITEINTFEILIQVSPNVGAEIEESEDYCYVGGFLPMPANAAVGEYVRVAAVDARGIVSAVQTAEVGDAVVDVPTKETYDLTSTNGTLTRYSFYVGSGPISLGEYNCYRINKVSVMAVPGCTVRYALFALQRNEDNTGMLTQIAVLGDAAADIQTGVAALTFEGGYYVSQNHTVIMALAAEQVIRCCRLGESMVVQDLLTFEDGNYVADETAEIPCNFSAEGTADAADPCFSCCGWDIDFLSEQSVTQYIENTAESIAAVSKRIGTILPPATVMDNGKVLTVVDGAYDLAEPAVGESLPAVTSDDNGKFLRVTDGVWAAVSVGNAEGVSF